MTNFGANSIKCTVCGDPATNNYNQGFYCDDCVKTAVPLDFSSDDKSPSEKQQQ
jgi:hypothetical protein